MQSFAAPEHAKPPASREFWILAVFLAIIFLSGGASRGDAKSLILLRPLGVLAMAYGLADLGWRRVRHFPVSFALLGSATVLTAAHLIPLPPAVWAMLPGRDLIVEIDRMSGADGLWRPLSMAPAATRNALYSLTVPLAVLLLAVRLDERDRARLLPVFILFGIASGLLGVLQVAAGQGSTLFLYDQSMTGTAVGLFANRNHNGVLLASLFPLLTAYAARCAAGNRDLWVVWLAAAGAVVLVPLILVVGSRASLLCAVLAIALSPFLAADRLATLPRQVRRRFVLAYLLGCGAMLILGLIFVLAARAESIQRLIASSTGDDRRLQVWKPVVGMIERYFPAGSGIGSYVQVFQANEPRSILARNYSNHVHNDWLEVAMTAGLPGLLLLGAALGSILVLSWKAWRFRTTDGAGLDRAGCVLSKTASIVLTLLGLASMGDYPLRVPSMMALFVVALVWLEARSPAAEFGDATTSPPGRRTR